jgi:hypothetical protein
MLDLNWYNSQASVETNLDAADTECPRHNTSLSYGGVFDS